MKNIKKKMNKKIVKNEQIKKNNKYIKCKKRKIKKFRKKLIEKYFN